MKIPQQITALLRADVLLYAGLLAAYIALVWVLPFFPSQDGSSHIYNLVILRDLLQGQGNWGRFFTVGLQLRPNLGFHLVAYPLLFLLKPLAAERVFLTVYILLVTVAVPVYLRAFGRAALPLSFFVFVVVFNRPLLMGFYSDVLGIPLLLFALVLAWNVRQRTLVVRVVALNIAGLILFVVHLVPFAIFLLALGLMALSLANTWKERARGLAAFAAVLSPCLLLFSGMFLLNQARANLEVATRMEHTQIAGQLWHRVIAGIEPLDLASFSGLWFSRWHTVLGLVALLLFTGAAVNAARRMDRSRDSLDQSNSNSRFLVTLCAALVFLYLAAPDQMLGAGRFKLRLPWVILLLAVPLIESGAPRFSSKAWEKLLVSLAVVTLAVNIALVWRQSYEVKQFTCGLQAPLRPGAVIMAARFDRKGWPPDPLLHAASYYGLHGYVDYANYEPTQPHLFPLRFRQNPPETVTQVYTGPQTIDWLRFPEVQFLLSWKVREDDRSLLSQWFTLFWEKNGCPLTIWKRNEHH